MSDQDCCSCHISPPCGYCLSLCASCSKKPRNEVSEDWDQPLCHECWEAAGAPRKDPSVIPKGEYCYTPAAVQDGGPGVYKIKPCPYWSSDPTKESQQNGHCSFLGYGDWEEEHLSLLWDQVKECGVNMGDDE